MNMDQSRNHDSPQGQVFTEQEVRELDLFQGSGPIRKRNFLHTVFQDFFRPFSFGGVEPRREFWTFALIGVPVAGTLIASLALFTAIPSISRVLPEISGAAGRDNAASDREGLVADATEALHLAAAPFAFISGPVIAALVVIAALLQAWLLLSLVAATRRRLADAGADRSLSLVWPLLPAATVLNIPGGLTLGIVLMAIATVVGGAGGEPTTEVLLALAFLPIWLPVIFCGVLVSGFCMRRSQATVYTKRSKLWWVLLVVFAPALVWVVISLPGWASVGAWLSAAGAEAQAVIELIMLWALTWVVLPLTLFGVAAVQMSNGLGDPRQHKVGTHRRLTKKGYVTVSRWSAPRTRDWSSITSCLACSALSSPSPSSASAMYARELSTSA